MDWVAANIAKFRLQYKLNLRYYSEERLDHAQSKRNNYRESTTTPQDAANKLVKEWFLERSPDFFNLWRFKLEEWHGDDSSYKDKKARHNDPVVQNSYHSSFKESFLELENAHHFIPTALEKDEEPKRMLDICMAGGGFAAVTRGKNPDLDICGYRDINDPMVEYGDSNFGIPVKLCLADITLLHDEFGAAKEQIPLSHGDIDNFKEGRAFTDHRFDLVVADGHVLDEVNTTEKETQTQPQQNHPQYHYRPKDIKYYQLTAAKLVIGLNRIKSGGTFVLVRMAHESNAWETFKLITAFQEFCEEGGVKIFKPTKAHKRNSSFYVVAKGVQPGHPAARALVEHWTRIWRWSTFAEFAVRYGKNPGNGSETDVGRTVEDLEKETGDVSIGKEENIEGTGGQEATRTDSQPEQNPGMEDMVDEVKVKMDAMVQDDMEALTVSEAEVLAELNAKGFGVLRLVKPAMALQLQALERKLGY